MAARCPSAEPDGPAKLTGYRLVFASSSERWGGAVADIREDRKWYVQGGIYRLKESDLESLDGYEGVPNFYVRMRAEIVIPSGEKIIAWTYRMIERQDRGKPSRAYLETILKGFSDFNIAPPPEVSAIEYID